MTDDSNHSEPPNSSRRRDFQTPCRMPAKEERELLTRLRKIEAERGADDDVAFLLDLVSEYMETAYSAWESSMGEDL